jgi:hypothetical protein
VQPPPASPALERALAGLRPIRTRRPARVLFGVAAASLTWATALVCELGVRKDLGALRSFPFAVYAAACFATFIALLWCALVPPRGQVLSSGSASARATALMLVALIGLDLAIAIYPLAGGHLDAGAAARFVAAAWHCVAAAGGVVAVPLALGLWSLRSLLPLGGWRVVMAVGGAAGALAGLVLHVHCSVADPAHVGLVHGAILVLPAVILALATAGRLSSRPDHDMTDEVARHGS